MSKKAMQIAIIHAMMCSNYQWSGLYWDNHKEISGSPIYVPKRHKFKRRLKR